ncbi:MAG: PD-(D/E)XK nuclease family protein [Candidatus Omnitrophica bacterium]|nr:PD-(D/E)XK nuclease family protein [Candidatus Omnitrophota bacterium]
MSQIITYSFCEPFIDRLADHIEENYLKKGNDLSRLAVVSGGRRPALFLNRELSKRVRKNFYPPRFFGIDEFVSYTVQKKELFTSGQDLDQCYLIYQLAQKHAPEVLKGRATFAQFLPWTREILNFIEQLDLEDVADLRLANIQANATIGYDVPEDINRILKHVIVLRGAYHEYIRARKIYSRGFQYWRASQLIDEIRFEEFDQFLFCNFFYFNRSEERIVQSLYERGQATLIFQGDERKWPVLERISRRFSSSLREEGETIPTPGFRLNLCKAFDVHSQVAAVREILKKVKHPEKTVIVLPDADSLVPLLSEIASLVEEFNISMGYPLRRSSLYSLCSFVFYAQLSKKNDRYYAKDYLKTLRHPFVKNLELSENVPAAATRTLIHKIEEILTGKVLTAISGSLFIKPEDIAGLDDLYQLTLETTGRLGIKTSRKELQRALEEIHRILFTGWESLSNFQEFAACLGGFLDVLLEKSFMKKYPLNLNIARRMYEVKDELSTASFRHETFDQEEMFKIFDAKIARELVAFHGSPLKGLQILGLFETRSLNFENVIVLDVNEGVLPKLNIYAPLIPREVMISLNLDQLELEEEIQRYQFMRLLSSAKDVHLIYRESKDREKSRFVEELIWEEQKRRKTIDVVPPVQTRFALKVTPRKTSIPKTPAMIERLRGMRYSASSVNMYLRNPVEFYYNYVLGLKETEDLLDEPEARQVGTFLHELLEDAFRPFLSKKPQIDSAFRSRFAKIFESKFEATLARSMRSDAFLLKAIITGRMERFLDNEASGADRQVEEVLHLESRFEDLLRLPCGDIRFTYVVDRVDRLSDGTHMIVDYKAGAIDQMPRNIASIAAMTLTRESIAENIRSFQLPLYFHYLDRMFPGKPVNAALYNLRTLKFDKFMDAFDEAGRRRTSEVFLKALDFVMSEIFDPETSFESEEDVIPGARTQR